MKRYATACEFTFGNGTKIVCAVPESTVPVGGSFTEFFEAACSLALDRDETGRGGLRAFTIGNQIIVGRTHR